MANYCPMVRSSYFKPKDQDAFNSFCRRFELTRIEDTEQGEELVGFLVNDENGMPNCVYTEGSDECEECEEIGVEGFFSELAEQIASGWAVEVREIGYEKMRYLVGVTTLVRWDGETCTLSLDEVEERACKEWGPEFKLTACAY